MMKDIILCRNEDIDGVRDTMTNLEQLFNRNYNYPYVFINNEPWKQSFKDRVLSYTQSQVQFVNTLEGTWGYPDYINQTYAAECRYKMRDLMYGDNEGYRYC